MSIHDHYKMISYVEQTCGDCIIRIEAWRPWKGDFGFVDVQVISNSSTAWHLMWRNRLKNAWRVLRGRYDWSGFEVFTRDEAEAITVAIQNASKEAFPKVISTTTIKRT